MNFSMSLSGGGTKGAAHVGVLLALEEENLLPASISGTSAGSIVAGLYACGFSPAQLKQLVLDLSRNGYRLIDPDILGAIRFLLSLVTKTPANYCGLLKGKRLEQFLCKLTSSKNIRDISMKLVIPAVDLNSGTTIVYSNASIHQPIIGQIGWETNIPLCKAIRASSAVPMIFKPVLAKTQCLVDGGVTDILPVDLLYATGERNILAVDISETYLPPESCNLIEIGSHSFSVMSNRLRSYVASKESYLLKINLPDKAGLLTFSYMEECMEAGYQTAKKELPQIKKALHL